MVAAGDRGRNAEKTKPQVDGTVEQDGERDKEAGGDFRRICT